MPTLSSSIVKHHVATMREVEEALARQVVYGGDLVTNLLELAQVSEAQLTWLLADSLGLTPAPIGELPAGPQSVLQLVPPELAQRHGIYPMSESDGAVELAVSDRLPPDVEDQLSFTLGLRIVQRAAPLVRIHQALARDRGIPLDRRMLRLVARLEGRPDPSPSSFPAPLREAAAGFPKLPRPASMPPIGYPSGAQPEAPPPVAEPTAAAPPSQEEQSTGRAPAVTLINPREEQPAGRAPAVTLITPRHPAQKSSPPSAPPPDWLPVDKPRERGRRRQRGPYTAAMAEHDLLEAGSRDDVVAAFFDFVSQYFEYTALFAVQGDIAEGRDAHGPGTDREAIRAIGFPLDLPSALSQAKKAATFQLVKLGVDGLDANLAKDLGREAGRAVMVLPLIVRSRCVLLLYGDHGDTDVALGDIGDIIAFAPLASAALERVILKKKLSRQTAAQSQHPARLPVPAAEMRRRQRHTLPAIEQRVHALASAFDTSPRSPSRPPSAPPGAPSAPAPTTVAASPGAMAGPSTAHESPMAKAGPTTLEESPRAKRPSGETQLEEPLPIRPPEPVAFPPAADPGAERDMEPATTAGSPRALAAFAESQAPETPEETPLARARAAEGPLRRNTPPQGTPGAVPPIPVAEDQPFPLTRRAPSSRIASSGPTSGEMLAAVDGGWDSASSVREPGSRAGSSPSPSSEEPKSDVGQEAPLAPASRQLALGPRPPFRRQDAKDRLLPSVIVDVNADSRLLVEQLIAGEEEALDAVIRVGDAAVSHLVAAFPGPLHPDRKRSFAEPGARASDVSLLLRALARIGSVAIPFVVVRTADRDPQVRGWATWLLGELPSAESARAVVRRFSDADSNVRRAALAAGRMLQADVEARTALRDSLATMAAEQGQAAETRHDAIQALADLRDGRAVPRLIPLLDNENAALQRSAHWALVTLARQDFGYDSAAWVAWWEEAGGRHRIEWLIDALTHERIEIRRAAGEELKAQTKEYFGYYEDLSPKERERAQQAYREWWLGVGKARFP